jgi:hypothetical protein
LIFNDRHQRILCEQQNFVPHRGVHLVDRDQQFLIEYDGAVLNGGRDVFRIGRGIPDELVLVKYFPGGLRYRRDVSA